jgi:CheY-like chemotaxis protein
MPKKKNKKILLIDDEPIIVSLYKTLFEPTPYEFFVAMNKDVGLMLIQRVKPNLLLLDLILPAPNQPELSYEEPVGLEILREVKQNAETKEIVVLVLTNIDNEKNRKIAKELGAQDYFVKANLEPHELVKKVNQYLNV